MKKIGLVLGGGGARGLAHVGVLQALEKANIQIDILVGCSFGALIGGLYAQHPDAEMVYERLYKFMYSDAFKNLGLEMVRKRSIPSDDTLRQLTRNIKDWVMLNVLAKRISILKQRRLLDVVSSLIDDREFADYPLTFACNATDIVSGKPVLFHRGKVRPAIAASMTIPGFFPPMEINGQMLVDGAVTANLPIAFARQLGAEFIIAVDIHPHLHPENDFRNVIDVILRTNTITANTLSEATLKGADILIQPPVKEYYWYEFDRYKEIIQAGEAATNMALPEIYRQFSRLQRRRLLRKVGL